MIACMAHEGAGEVWRIATDTGGTFTDCLGVCPRGVVHRAKLLSAGLVRAEVLEVDGARVRVGLGGVGDASGLVGARVRRADGAGDESGGVRIARVDGAWLTLDGQAGWLGAGVVVDIATGEPAPVVGARLLTGTGVGEAFPPMEVRIATTRGTNALLERTHARTALFTTRGFGDLLAIGDQRRPDLFAIDIVKRPAVTEMVYEVGGRMGARGDEVEAFDAGLAREACARAMADGAQVAAVALLNAWANDAHERAMEWVCREAGFEVVARSSEIAPTIKLLTRAQTAVVDASLTPVMGGFLDAIGGAMPDAKVEVMTSAGGVVDAGGFRACDGLLSGPAGGVVGALSSGLGVGEGRVLSFDMGGTSTDVARLDGRVGFVFAHRVGDAEVARPAAAIETVAAGGGSVCRFVDGRARVGPESAGATPGPACYGAGGPLTITDVNLLLGRIDEERFALPIDRGGAERALAEVLRDGEAQVGRAVERDAVLSGFLDLANERMADAIRRVSIRRGYDPADHALVAFGGAGPQHACAIAELLGVERVVVPRDASLLSARGLMESAVERHAERTVLAPLGEVVDGLDGVLGELEGEARRLLGAGGPEELTVRRIVSLRFVGQDHTVEVEGVSSGGLAAAFGERYSELFGHVPGDREVECVAARVVVARPAERVEWGAAGGAGCVEAVGERGVCVGGRWERVRVFERGALGAGARIEGAALIGERRSATVVNPGWSCEVAGDGALVLVRAAGEDATASEAERDRGALGRELIVGRLDAIAEVMGERLRWSAVSANIRERLDYSCCVLDAAGRLVASAPHVPVHLGAMGVCVRAVVAALGGLGEGDVAVTNHPAHGGSHLPDVTVVHPVHVGGALVGYVASRAHHAEIGGRAPGSMPPDARRLEEEGVVIAPMRLYEGGRERWGVLRELLGRGAWPSRRVGDNLADIEAAVGAGREGVRLLRDLCGGDPARRAGPPGGVERVREAMAWVMGHTSWLVGEALGLDRAGGDAMEAREVMDNGSVICVRIERVGGRLRVDFGGTSAQVEGNLNAPVAIVHSAVGYVVRLLVEREVSLNEGLLGAVDLVVPEGCLLNPVFGDDASAWPAVAAGNVETSQRVVDALVRALGLAAASQGTMNNLLYGDETFGSYETICGGAGATARAGGAHAVHTHMTNTAIADPEIVEHRCPVRLRRFAVRRGSGGAGVHAGGDGVVREVEFLRAARVSVIGQNRVRGARGAEGGGDGAPARVRVERAGGAVEELAWADGRDVGVGDRVVVETPGGGAWGAG